MDAVCSIAECGKPVRARGWCGTHYARWRNNGSPDVVRTPGRLRREPKLCLIDGCEQRSVTRKMCRLHYQQWRLGTIDAARCSADGCESKAREDGRCGRHFSKRDMVELTGSKACSECARTFPANHYERDYRYPDRGVAKCRECMARGRSDASFRRRYGITRNDYDEMLAAQGGGCAICSSTHRLCVDHDHQTGAVRKILCDRCNLALGVVDDDHELLNKLADYLLAH